MHAHPSSLLALKPNHAATPAMEAAGLAALLPRAELTTEGGHVAALSLLKRAARPTAIFASNDLRAIGVYQAARELGLRIPAPTGSALHSRQCTSHSSKWPLPPPNWRSL